MESNFQKCPILETGAGNLESRRRYIVEGRSVLERATNMETKW